MQRTGAGPEQGPGLPPAAAQRGPRVTPGTGDVRGGACGRARAPRRRPLHKALPHGGWAWAQLGCSAWHPFGNGRV